jgi:NYN domain
MRQCILYVDGFNFYYGVTKFWRDERKWAGLGWCDFRALIERHFALDGAQLEIKYFTAPVYLEHELPTHPEGEHKRNAFWLRAVRTISGISVIEGFYKKDRNKRAAGEVRNPDAPAKSREEKQSDINLAVEVMLDALGPDPPERVYLLSDDTDLMPVVFALLERLPKPIPVTVLLPSESGDGKEWKARYQGTAERLLDCGVASRKQFLREPAINPLSKEVLANSLLHYKLRDTGGEFECLGEWRLPRAFLERHCRPEWQPDAPPTS